MGEGLIVRRNKPSQNSILYLYNEGNQQTNITGGWASNGNTDYTNTAPTINSNNIICEVISGIGQSIIETVNQINLNNYSSIHFIISNTLPDLSGARMIKVQTTSVDNDSIINSGNAFINIGTIGEQYELVLNINTLNGLYYINVGVYAFEGQSANITIHKIWLE